MLSSKRCPSCCTEKPPIKDFPAKLRTELGRLHVICNDGCGATLYYGDFEQHILHECPSRLNCEGCTEKQNETLVDDSLPRFRQNISLEGAGRRPFDQIEGPPRPLMGDRPMPEDDDDIPNSPYTSQDTTEMEDNVNDSLYDDNFRQHVYLPILDVPPTPGYCARVKTDMDNFNGNTHWCSATNLLLDCCL